jgi:glycosyltransferase involved in cell wall biosynthesis
MNILHIISDTDPKKGGVTQGLKTLIKTLSERGIYNEISSLDASNASYLNDEIFNLNALGPGKGPWQYSPKLIPWLANNIKRFDFIIVHGLWLFHLFAAYKALKNLKNISKKNSTVPKLFILPHGMLDPYFQNAKNRKLKALRNRIYWKLIQGKIINNADAILFTTETERQVAHYNFTPYNPKNEAVIGMAVDLPPPYASNMMDEFNNKCLIKNHQPYILFLSRIHEKKAIDLLIRAYLNIIVTNKIKDLPKLIIAGPGTETQFGQKLQKLVNQSKIGQNSIIFTGMLTGNAKWGAFYGCDAFILPSHQENFGIAIVEALACGKPVLISNKVNIWREIEEGKAGIVVNDTFEEIQSVLEDWIYKPSESKLTFSENAIKTFENNFSTKTMAERFLSVLLCEF